MELYFLPSGNLKNTATSLTLILLLISFADAARATGRQPGFLYTRTRGRCTPQFWSSGIEEWPKMVPQTSTVLNVFGSRASERYRSELTLLESTGTTEDSVYSELVKEASAALLNSYARKGFPYSAWEVKTLMIQGLVSEDAAVRLTKRFSIANEICS